MIIKKVLNSVVILFVAVYSGAAANLNNTPDILIINSSAKMAALGNIGIGKDTVINGLLTNPAYIFNADSLEVSVGHNIWMEQNGLESVSGVYPTLIGNFGLNFSYFYQPSDSYINISGEDTGITLDKKDFGVSGVYAEKIFGITSGIAVRYFHHSLAGYSANSFIFDFGIKRDYLFGSGKLLTGIGIKNIGFSTAFISEKYIIPFYIPLEFAYIIRHNIAEFSVLTGINIYSTGEIACGLGTELSFFGRYMLRAGYRTGYDMMNLSLGMGVEYEFNNILFKFDYGIIIGNGLGATHILQLTAKFNSINTGEIPVKEVRRIKPASIVNALKGDTTKIIMPLKIISAEASSSVSSKPEDACDGNEGTRWDSMHKQDPQWIIFKLRFAQLVGSIQIHWETAGAEVYDVFVSEDKSSWEKVASVKDGKKGETRIIKFSKPVEARYIKIFGKKRCGADWGYSIWEVKVYK